MTESDPAQQDGDTTTETETDASETTEEITWQSDLAFIAKLVVATYIGFAILGAVTGVSNNEIAGFLATVTFYAGVFGLAALALNLHWGYTGLFNIGVVGFMAVGVYTFAILTAAPDASPAGFGLPLFVGVIGGTIAAGLVGAVIALPALRVRADYFAIITLGFSEIVRLAITSGSLQNIEIGDRVYGTGGGSGIRYTPVDTVVPWLTETVNSVLLYLPGWGLLLDGIWSGIELFGVTSSVIDRFLYGFVLVVFILLFYALLNRIARSPFGRILKAIREDEVAARSLGKRTQRTKLTVFMLGAALMGLAGILWLGSRSSTNPDNLMPVITFYIFVALIIGGEGSNTGSVVGGFIFAAFLWEGPRYLRTAMDNVIDISAPSTINVAMADLAAADPLPLLAYFINSTEELRWVAVGVILILLMIYRPNGILGDRKEIAAAVNLSERSRGETDE